jgi:hypothetical protein
MGPFAARVLLSTLIAAPLAACTVQTEDDSVPGNAHGWGGFYFVHMRYAGYVEDGRAGPFVSGFSLVDHGVTAE